MFRGPSLTTISYWRNLFQPTGSLLNSAWRGLVSIVFIFHSAFLYLRNVFIHHITQYFALDNSSLWSFICCCHLFKNAECYVSIFRICIIFNSVCLYVCLLICFFVYTQLFMHAENLWYRKYWYVWFIIASSYIIQLNFLNKPNLSRFKATITK